VNGLQISLQKGGILLPVIFHWKISASLCFETYYDVGDIASRANGSRFARTFETTVLNWFVFLKYTVAYFRDWSVFEDALDVP
jgi:hypothetical protein